MRLILPTGPARAIRALATLIGLAGFSSSTVASEHVNTRPPFNDTTYPSSQPVTEFVVEAARRFDLPPEWIRVVMQAESSGDVDALSSAGAMGLMQVMPQTWAELRARYDLGSDPYDPRDNILAGTAYLRELLDRFGAGGFIAAYNAGPQRYEEHLATGRSLPQETRDYLVRLGTVVTDAQTEGGSASPTVAADWRSAPLFIERSGDESDAQARASDRSPLASPGAATLAPRFVGAMAADGLFVPRSASMER